MNCFILDLSLLYLKNSFSFYKELNINQWNTLEEKEEIINQMYNCTFEMQSFIEVIRKDNIFI